MIIRMPKSRKTQICYEATPYYHCVSRCVRRAFLCGVDDFSGRNYEHRRQWIEDRLLQLAEVFCIDICAYAVMNNHTHIVLHVDLKKVQSLTTEEVLSRWCSLFNGSYKVQCYLNANLRKNMNKSDLEQVEDDVSEYRNRLSSVSWFMRSLNEYIARKANEEDKCTGRFWEGRFKSQPLLDGAAVAACMAYNDLNPLRAGMVESVEQSSHTSIKRRMLFNQRDNKNHGLMPFADESRGERVNSDASCLPFTEDAYLALLKEAQHQINNEASLANESCQKALFEAFGLTFTNWMQLATNFESLFSGPVGNEIAMRAFQDRVGLQRLVDITACKLLS